MAYGDNIFTAIIDENGVIYEASTGRKRQAVGIDAQKEQEYQQTIAEMQERLDSYYAKLVELGVIQIPKTTEEIALEQAAQQAEINKQLLEAIGGLQFQIKEMQTNGFSRYGDESRNEQFGQDSSDAGEITSGSKRSNSTRKKNNTSNNE